MAGMCSKHCGRKCFGFAAALQAAFAAALEQEMACGAAGNMAALVEHEKADFMQVEQH